ncbi:endomucin isoform X3 [Arvicanthis niloticus]|uniref:endomucin isoform X3 n=1 Tax=Arvicanthis niloticus TaxID=61156 RepID=UPI00402B207D
MKPLRPSVGTMWLLQATAVFFLLSNSLCRGEDGEDVQNNSTSLPAEPSTTKASAITPGIVSVTNLDKSTGGTTPEATTNSKVTKTPLLPALHSTPKHEVETSTDRLLKNEVFIIKTTVPNPPISKAVSTLPSSQNKTENQTSIGTTEISATSQLPDASPKTPETPSAPFTTAKTISQLQGIILPVVIALIVITLLVFTLVGLYRICWKRDPGTPENGNDQPQSDKESVKLLTVKTISHESGEHSAQGKTKN